MKKFLITFFVSILTFTHLSAADNTATKTVDKVIEKMQSAPSISLVITAQSPEYGTQRARLLMAKSMFTYSFGELLTFYDGKTQWTIDNDGKEIYISTPTPDELAETNPFYFLSNYDKNYNVTLVTQQDGSVTLKFDAKNKSAFVRTARVVINTSTWIPSRIDANLSSGSQMDVTVTSANIGKSLSQKDFRPDMSKFSGYETIDLR